MSLSVNVDGHRFLANVDDPSYDTLLDIQRCQNILQTLKRMDDPPRETIEAWQSYLQKKKDLLLQMFDEESDYDIDPDYLIAIIKAGVDRQKAMKTFVANDVPSIEACLSDFPREDQFVAYAITCCFRSIPLSDSQIDRIFKAAEFAKAEESIRSLDDFKRLLALLENDDIVDIAGEFRHVFGKIKNVEKLVVL